MRGPDLPEPLIDGSGYRSRARPGAAVPGCRVDGGRACAHLAGWLDQVTAARVHVVDAVRSESRSLRQAGGSSGSVRLSVRIGAVARCRSQVVSKPRGISARSLRTRVSPARAGRLPMAACSRLSTNGATSRSTRSPPGSAGRSRGTAQRRSARVYAETSRFTADGTTLLYVWYPRTEPESVEAERPTELRQHPDSRRRVTTPVERHRQQRAGIETLVGRRRHDPRQRMASGAALATRGRRPGNVDDPRDPSHRDHVAQRRLAFPRRGASSSTTSRIRRRGCGISISLASEMRRRSPSSAMRRATTRRCGPETAGSCCF